MIAAADATILMRRILIKPFQCRELRVFFLNMNSISGAGSKAEKKRVISQLDKLRSEFDVTIRNDRFED